MEKIWATGMQRKAICGIAPPPRRAALLVILWEMDTSESQTRSEYTPWLYIIAHLTDSF